MVTLQKNADKCAICKSKNIIMDMETGEKVCRDCGYVQSDNSIDTGPEWRAFNLQQREERTRTGAPIKLTIHDHGLSTSISRRNRDYAGRDLKPDVRSQFYRLRKWNRRTKVTDSTQRNLAKALSYMTHLANELSLPQNISETGAIVYRQVLKKGATRGRTIKNLVVASLYIACRICGISRSLKTFAEEANITKKEAARNYRYLHNLLDKDIPSISTGKVISKLVKQLNLSGKVEMVALELFKTATDMKLTSGKSPTGIAAACIYVGCRITGEKITQHKIAAKGKITEVTIRNRYKELVNRMDIMSFI